MYFHGIASIYTASSAGNSWDYIFVCLGKKAGIFCLIFTCVHLNWKTRWESDAFCDNFFFFCGEYDKPNG